MKYNSLQVHVKESLVYHLGVVLCLRLPGDSRTKIGFLTFDSTIHFYNLQEGLSQPQMLVVSDIDGTSPPQVTTSGSSL